MGSEDYIQLPSGLGDRCNRLAWLSVLSILDRIGNANA